jgi:hypothetical protein
MLNLIRSFIIIVLLVAPARAQVAGEMAAVTTAQLRALQSSLTRAGMTDGDAGGMVEGMVEAQYSGEQMAMIGQQVQAAAGDRSTREAVISKIREGMAKRVGPEGIVKATDRVRERYGFAMETAKALTKEQYASLGGIIADSLSSGLSQPDAKRITHGLQTRSEQMGKDSLQSLAAETMLTARDMVRLGVSSQVASAVVGEALARGYDAAAMEALRQTFNTQRMQSNMDQVAQRFGLAIRQGVSARDLGAHAGAGGSGGEGNGAGGKSSGGSGAGGGKGSGSGGSGSGGGGKGGGSGSGGGGGKGGR